MRVVREGSIISVMGGSWRRISNEVCSRGVATGRIHCLAEEAQDGVTGKAESFRTPQCTSTEQVYCGQPCAVLNLVQAFSNERQSSVWEVETQ